MKRIVLIDDDIVLRQTLSGRLRNAGYIVLEAMHGGEAVQHARLQSVDLVITDMLMPEMEGVETIRTFRHFFPGVKIIAMSGGGVLAGERHLEVARKLGAHRTLSKPFTLVELILAVIELVGEAGAAG